MTAPIKHRTELPKYKGPLAAKAAAAHKHYTYKDAGEPRALIELKIGTLFRHKGEVYKYMGRVRVDPGHREFGGELIRGEWESPPMRRFHGDMLVQPVKGRFV